MQADNFYRFNPIQTNQSIPQISDTSRGQRNSYIIDQKSKDNLENDQDSSLFQNNNKENQKINSNQKLIKKQKSLNSSLNQIFQQKQVKQPISNIRKQISVSSKSSLHNINNSSSKNLNQSQLNPVNKSINDDQNISIISLQKGNQSLTPKKSIENILTTIPLENYMKNWKIKIFIYFIFQIISANIVTIGSFSKGQQNIFIYISTPFMGLFSAIMLHSIVAYHPYTVRNLGKYTSNISFSIFLVLVYVISVFWAKLFIQEQMEIKTYLYPLINIIIFILYAFYLHIIFLIKGKNTLYTHFTKDEQSQKSPLRTNKNQVSPSFQSINSKTQQKSNQQQQVYNQKKDQEIIPITDYHKYNLENLNCQFETQNQKNQIKIWKFFYGLAIICTLSVGQLMYSMNLLVIFDSIVQNEETGTLIVCGIFYPLVCGSIFLFQGTLAKKFQLNLEWELFFLEHIGASIPYRFVYFSIVEDKLQGILLIFVKIVFKSITYIIVPLNFAKIQDLKFQISNSKMVKKFQKPLQKSDLQKELEEMKLKTTEKFVVIQYTDIVNQITVFLAIINIKYIYKLQQSPIALLTTNQIETLGIQAIIENIADFLLIIVYQFILSRTKTYSGLSIKKICSSFFIRAKDGIIFLLGINLYTYLCVFLLVVNDNKY